MPASDAWPELVCPLDGQALARDGERLRCRADHDWPVRDDIPRMISSGDQGYAAAFGTQWKTFRRTQLDSYTGTTLSSDRARRCLGSEILRLLSGRDPVQVLEVGCGAGRFTEVLLALGPNVRVTSVDLSAAVEANQENFPQDDRHRVIQADVQRLPFTPRQYGVVFCLGTVQHTPDPETTLQRLFEQVAPGGWLVIDHYTYSLSRLTKSAPLFRAVLRRLPPGQGLAWTTRLVDGLLPVHRAVRRSRLAQAVLSRVSPVLSYYHALPLDDELQREWALLDTHDALTDWYKHLRTRAQIRRALMALGGTDIWCQYGGNGVEARCRAPGPRLESRAVPPSAAVARRGTRQDRPVDYPGGPGRAAR